MPQKDQLDDNQELMTSLETDPTTSQSFDMSMRLFVQALRTLPYLNYIFLTLAFVFLILFQFPLSSLWSPSSVSAAESRRQQRSSSSSSKR